MIVYVQFSDETQTRIVTAFLGPQDPQYWPGLVEIEDTDQRYIAFITPSTDAAEKLWRNAELTRADEELNKVQDADPKAVGTVAQWREYRRALRNYPESEGFSSGIRPVSPK